MKCCKCPLYDYSSSEDGSYECCGLFGDDWEHFLQYEDKDGTTIGCYLDRHFIEKRAKEYDDELKSCVEWYLKNKEISEAILE